MLVAWQARDLTNEVLGFNYREELMAMIDRGIEKYAKQGERFVIVKDFNLKGKSFSLNDDDICHLTQTYRKLGFTVTAPASLEGARNSICISW